MPNFDHKEASRETFDKVAKNYEAHYMGRHSLSLHPKVMQFITPIPHNSILDVGCGPGNLLANLDSLGTKLYGSDISPEMIRRAKERLGDRAELKVADSEHLPWPDNNFDVVISTDSFHHYPSPEAVLREMGRVLVSKGHLVIADPYYSEFFRKLLNYSFRFSKQGDVKVYSQDEWKSMLKNTGLKLLDWDTSIRGSVVLKAQFE